MQTTIGKFGGTNTKQMKDADLIVLGTKPGPKKLEEIKENDWITISEEEFMKKIRGEGPIAEPPRKKQKI